MLRSCEHAQQLGLQRRVHLADLVEEERAAVGGLEAADARARGAGEGALLVAEELALEQVLGDRGAVDDDEGLVARGAEIVDRARDELLAGAALAGDQHGRARRRDALDGAEHAAHHLALADQAPEPRLARHLVAQAHDFLFERAALEELAHLDAQRVDLEGLGHEVGGAELHRLDGGRDGARRREHQHRRRVVALGQLAQEVDAGATGHHEIEQHGVGGTLVEQRKSRVDVARGRHVELVLEQHPQRLADTGLIVDDEDVRHRRGGAYRSAARSEGAGSSIRTEVSPLAPASTASEPPCARTTASTAATDSAFSPKPSPWPWASRKRSRMRRRAGGSAR